MMEVDQEHAETMRHRRVLHCQPSVLDVTAYNSGEEFDLGFLVPGDTDEMDVDSDCNSDIT